MRMIATILTVGLAAPAFAQEFPKPGPEHESLKKHEGTWDLVMKFGAEESKGTIKYAMEMNGLWLVGSMDCAMLGQKYSGKSLVSYDPAKKKYVELWVDSMNAQPVVLEGEYDEVKKTLTMTGTGPGHDGPATKFKSVTETPDADTEVMTMYMGDGKDPAFTITYKRKK